MVDEKTKDKTSLPTKSLQNNDFFTRRAKKTRGAPCSFEFLDISLILKLLAPYRPTKLCKYGKTSNLGPETDKNH
jgi:hypothetical protein